MSFLLNHKVSLETTVLVSTPVSKSKIAVLVYKKVKKVKAVYSASWETHLRATGRHLPYGITQC